MTNLALSINEETTPHAHFILKADATAADRPFQEPNVAEEDRPFGEDALLPHDPLSPFGNDQLADVLALSRDDTHRPIDASPLLLRFEHFDIAISPIEATDLELRVGIVETKRNASTHQAIRFDIAPKSIDPTWETQPAFADVMGQSIIRIERTSSDALLIAFDSVTMRVANRDGSLQAHLIRSWPYDSSSNLRK